LIVTKELGPSSTLFLSRLWQYYNYISILAAYLGAISLVLAPLAGRNEISSVAVAILMGSTMTAIAAVTISTMFRFTLHRSKLTPTLVHFSKFKSTPSEKSILPPVK
jgi:hypothetical protein